MDAIITDKTFGPDGTVPPPDSAPEDADGGVARLDFVGPLQSLSVVLKPPDILDWSDDAIQTLAYLGQSLANYNSGVTDMVESPPGGWGVFDDLVDWIEGNVDPSLHDGYVQVPKDLADVLFFARNAWLDISGVARAGPKEVVRVPFRRRQRRGPQISYTRGITEKDAPPPVVLTLPTVTEFKMMDKDKWTVEDAFSPREIKEMHRQVEVAERIREIDKVLARQQAELKKYEDLISMAADKSLPPDMVPTATELRRFKRARSTIKKDIERLKANKAEEMAKRP